jgi:hypothetical protein
MSQPFQRAQAFDIAELIGSGLAGLELAQALERQFPTAKRSDVYLAVGAAVALMQADLALAEMELDLARRGLSPHRRAA